MEQVGVPGPSRDLRDVSTSPSFVSDIDYKIIDFNRDSLPRNCENCYLDQFQLLLCYFGQPEKLIRYFQSHGVIKSESDTYCNRCSSLCRLDVVRKAFRCDRSECMHFSRWLHNSTLQNKVLIVILFTFSNFWGN